jgi:hypothetical protein
MKNEFITLKHSMRNCTLYRTPIRVIWFIEASIRRTV